MNAQTLGANLLAFTHRRVGERPGDRLFTFALTEVDKLVKALGDRPTLPREIYDNQKLGLLCTRELDTVDPSYCACVDEFLEAIRPPD